VTSYINEVDLVNMAGRKQLRKMAKKSKKVLMKADYKFT